MRVLEDEARMGVVLGDQVEPEEPRRQDSRATGAGELLPRLLLPEGGNHPCFVSLYYQGRLHPPRKKDHSLRLGGGGIESYPVKEGDQHVGGKLEVLGVACDNKRVVHTKSRQQLPDVLKP